MCALFTRLPSLVKRVVLYTTSKKIFRRTIDNCVHLLYMYIYTVDVHSEKKHKDSKSKGGHPYD